MMNFQSMLTLLIVLIIDIEGVRSVSYGNNTVGDLKYQVFLLRTGPFFCSGIAIDERHIVTAAHCVYEYIESPQMVTAERIIFEDFRDVYRVQRIHIPEKSRMMKSNNVETYIGTDVAILAVVPSISYGDEIVKIQLASREPRECETCIIAGWGREESNIINFNRKLLWTEAIILPSDLCLLLGSETNEDQLCTVHPNGKSTALDGDSGGPLLCSGMLSGIISMSSTNSKLPVTHTKVYSFSSSSFIEEVMKKSISIRGYS